MAVSFANLNCNGLRNLTKMDELFTYLKMEKFDVILLQETFWDWPMHEQACKVWDGTIISSFYSDCKRRGVSCLVNKNSNVDIIGLFLSLTFMRRTIPGKGISSLLIYTRKLPIFSIQLLSPETSIPFWTHIWTNTHPFQLQMFLEKASRTLWLIIIWLIYGENSTNSTLHSHGPDGLITH